MNADLIATARVHAERILLANGGELGLLGANQAYQQVWARDSMICGLGLLLCGEAGQAIHRRWRDYYRVRNLNQPHHYHNGGAWPFIGGFYVAALVQAGRLAEAERQLAKLAEMNRQGRTQEWEFNEWFHGISGRPMGFADQSWSAALYIYAHDAVTRGQAGFLGDGEDRWGEAGRPT